MGPPPQDPERPPHRSCEPPGVRAAATVVARTRNGAPEGGLQPYAFTLDVRTDDGHHREVRLEHAFWLLGLKPGPGDEHVGVRTDPDTGATSFDLAGDPRYDADALMAGARHRSRSPGEGGHGR